jgi:pimeloyl-ACP methyl ester carboxylesterase
MIPRLRAPLVLVHGFLGFDELRVGGWTLARYFANLPDALRAAGNRVLVARVSPTQGVARRAAELRALLDRELPGERVHLLGHSMGKSSSSSGRSSATRCSASVISAAFMKRWMRHSIW